MTVIAGGVMGIRKVAFSVAGVALATLSATDAVAAPRYLYLSSSDNDNVMLLDTQSRTGNTVWTVIVSGRLQYDEEDKYFYSLTYNRVEIDCPSRRTRTKAMEHKDAAGRSLWSRDNLAWEWSVARPGTLQESVVDAVCNPKPPSQDDLRFDDVEEALRTIVGITNKD